MSQFIWKEEYSVGVEEIDFEHKRLVRAIADLDDAISQHVTANELESVLNQIDSYISHHFSTEERYFERFGYADAEKHIALHCDFAKKISEFREKYENGQTEISNELFVFLKDWLHDHMLNVDRKYMECFKEHGLK